MESEIKVAKSLRWVSNQIPDDLGDSNEEKMLKCIKIYCQQGAETINKLEERIEFLQEQLERYRQQAQARTSWGLLK